MNDPELIAMLKAIDAMSNADLNDVFDFDEIQRMCHELGISYPCDCAICRMMQETR